MPDPAFMEMIYIDSDENARHTNVRAAMSTDAQTLAAFKQCRRLEVPAASAQFLLDYHDAEGDLVDTIFLDGAGFTAISGERVLTDAEYRAIDDEYWRAARAALATPSARCPNAVKAGGEKVEE